MDSRNQSVIGKIWDSYSVPSIAVNVVHPRLTLTRLFRGRSHHNPRGTEEETERSEGKTAAPALTKTKSPGQWCSEEQWGFSGPPGEARSPPALLPLSPARELPTGLFCGVRSAAARAAQGEDPEPSLSGSRWPASQNSTDSGLGKSLGTGLGAKGSKKRCLRHKRWWFPKILLEIEELFSYSWSLLKLAPRSEWTGTRLFPAKEGSWRKQFPTYLGAVYKILHLSFMETSNMVNTFKQIFGSTAPQLWWGMGSILISQEG